MMKLTITIETKDADDLYDMSQALEEITKAINNGERIGEANNPQFSYGFEVTKEPESHMAKFRVQITAMAIVSQTHIVEAENAEQARAMAVKPDLYNNDIWKYCGVEDGTVACDTVEPE